MHASPRVSQDNNYTVASQEHLGDEAIAIDRGSLFLALAGFGHLGQGDEGGRQ